MTTDDRIPRILAEVSLLDVLGEYGFAPSRFTTDAATGRCPHPDHPDKRASFTAKQRTWRCYSQCATGGDVIDLLVWLDGITKAQAIATLSDRIGLRRELQSAPRVRERLSPARAREVLDDFVTARGWDPETVAATRLSAVVDEWGKLRIRFPYLHDGDPVWHQDRALGNAKPKWLAPPGSQATLYNVDAFRLAEERSGCWLVEGPTDALALLSTFDNPAVLGCPGVQGFKDSWAAAFDGLEGVFLVADNDPAGEMWRAHLDRLFDALTTPLLHVRCPVGILDVDDWRRVCGCDNARFTDELLAAVVAAQGERDRCAS